MCATGAHRRALGRQFWHLADRIQSQAKKGVRCADVIKYFTCALSSAARVQLVKCILYSPPFPSLTVVLGGKPFFFRGYILESVYIKISHFSVQAKIATVYGLRYRKK